MTIRGDSELLFICKNSRTPSLKISVPYAKNATIGSGSIQGWVPNTPWFQTKDDHCMTGWMEPDGNGSHREETTI